MTDLDQKLKRARELLGLARHAAMATVNEDGSPHNTPYFFMRDDRLEHLYWTSHPRSQHSRNIHRTGQLFVVLYDADQSGGLYIRADYGRYTENSEIDQVLTVLNAYRGRQGKQSLSAADFNGTATQRLYIADVRQIWIHGATKNENGDIIHDQRYEVTAKDLLT